MVQNSMPSFNDLSVALERTELKLHPSQVHGLVTGILCGNPQSATTWEELIVGSKDVTDMHDLLQSLYHATASRLDEFLFEFDLLLPSDEQELPERAEALSLWCQGFLTGLKLVKVDVEGREPGEITDAIDDIIEIAKMNYEDVVASEEDENAYMDLVEFVRVAVILIYQDLRESEADNKTSGISRQLH